MYNLIYFFCSIENDLMSEIEKLTEEKHLQLQKISQLEEDIQKSSNLFYSYYISIIYIYVVLNISFIIKIRKK